MSTRRPPAPEPAPFTTAGKTRTQVRDDLIHLARTNTAEFLTLMASQPHINDAIRATYLKAARDVIYSKARPTPEQVADALEKTLTPRYDLAVQQRQINPVLRALRGQRTH